MTGRKPAGISWESWIDRQVREAQERGEFEHLPGAGKPIPGLGDTHDELWWLKQMLEREKLSVTPAALGLRKDVEQAIERIRQAPTESLVRRIVAAIIEKIATGNAHATDGPPSDIAPLDADRIVAQWRERQTG